MVLELWAKMLSANKIAGFFKMWYVKYYEVNDEVYLWYADKHWSLLQVDTVILGVYNHVGMPKVRKITSLHITISL